VEPSLVLQRQHDSVDGGPSAAIDAAAGVGIQLVIVIAAQLACWVSERVGDEAAEGA
jgi:hypothetical protein